MNWKTELESCLDFNGDKLELLVVKERTIPMAAQAVHIDHPVFDREFDSGFGAVEGCKFTAWGVSMFTSRLPTMAPSGLTSFLATLAYKPQHTLEENDESI